MSAMKSFLDVRRKEIPFVLSMFMYFFLVITVFWILKPIKKALFVNHYTKGVTFFGLDGAQAELLAKVGNMVVALVATIVFTVLSRRLHRHRLTLVFTAFSVAMLALFIPLLGTSSGLVAWSFYLFGDLFNTLMVATFFAFLNDSVHPDDSKRLYGPIVLGGVAGGAVGSIFVVALTKTSDISPSAWMVVSIVLTVVLGAMAVIGGRWVEKNKPELADGVDENEKGEEKPKVGLFDGAKLVFASRYLMAIVAIVGLYEIVSTILDYQFTSTVLHYVPQGVPLLADETEMKEAVGAAIGEHFSLVYAITNTVALLIQIFATTFVMKRLGVRIALLMMPFAILGNSVAFLALPILWVGSFLNTSDSGLNYSINQSARESLYTPTTREEKYAAKAFIDMFVQRFAKAVAVGVALLMSIAFSDFAGVRWLSIIAIALTAVWIVAASWVGYKFKELTGEEAGKPSKGVVPKARTVTADR
jgi:ATP:ADP antiporter, AAA family